MLRIAEAELKLSDYNCPLCGSHEIETIDWPMQRDQGLKKGICKGCGFLFHCRWMNYDVFLKWAKHHHKSPPNYSYYCNEQIKLAYFLKLLSDYEGPTWDFSAGMGIAGNVLAGIPDDVLFEFSESHARHGLLYDLKIETDLDSLFSRPVKTKPKQIIAHKVLSHIPHPAQFLERLRSVIDESDGSHLFITTFLLDKPTFDTIRTGLADEYFSFFTDDSLTALLAKSGFEIIERRFTAPFALFICRPSTPKDHPLDREKQKEILAFFKKGYECFFKNELDNLLKHLPMVVEAHVQKLRQLQDDLPMLVAGVETLLQNFPGNISAMEVAADFYHKAGDIHRSRVLLEACLKEYASYNILSLYGHVLSDCGEFEKAARCFHDALDFNPAPILGMKKGAEAIEQHYEWIQACLAKSNSSNACAKP